MNGYWEHFSHEADVGIRGIGETKADAFAQAALALMAILCDPDDVRPRDAITVDVEGVDDEFLFVNWIDRLVVEIATRRMLFARFEVAIDDHRLRATAYGEPIDRERHRPAAEAKGATLTELHVGQRPDRSWVAQCVVDV